MWLVKKTNEGYRIWQVYRLRNVYEVDHAGNREYTGDVYYTHEEAAAKADEMNKD